MFICVLGAAIPGSIAQEAGGGGAGGSGDSGSPPRAPTFNSGSGWPSVSPEKPCGDDRGQATARIPALTGAGDSPGFMARTSAAAPATCGDAMLVPSEY